MGAAGWSDRSATCEAMPEAAWRGGRRRHRRRAVRAAGAQRPAAGRDARLAGRAAVFVPAPAAGRAAPRQFGGSDAAVRLRPRPVLHQLRLLRAGHRPARDRHGRHGGDLLHGAQHRSPGRRRGRPAVPERSGGPGRPAGSLAGRLRPGPARAPARRAGSPSGCTPTGPRSPAGTLRPGPGWWNPARSGSRSAGPRTSCRCRARSRCADQSARSAPAGCSTPRPKSCPGNKRSNGAQ